MLCFLSVLLFIHLLFLYILQITVIETISFAHIPEWDHANCAMLNKAVKQVQVQMENKSKTSFEHNRLLL